MSCHLRFVFPWTLCAQSSNARLIRGKQGRFVNSQKYRDALEAIHVHARKQLGHPGTPTKRAWRVVIQVWVPDLRRRDVPNLVKPILDALEGLAWVNDYQVYDQRVVRMGVDREDPRIIVICREI